MFFLIDKPLGISSFDVIRHLRKVLSIRKMGHAGTLDPLATGLMLIATENSTKLLPLLDSATKEYIFTVRLDGVSESFDMGTPIRPHDMAPRRERTSEQLREYLLSQTSQDTPRYSALHIDGQRAYDLARKGEIFDTPKRKIEVSEVEIIEYQEAQIMIGMVLSSGGYIRSFAPLIGQFFGLPGGYISSLRRTHISHAHGELDISAATDYNNPLEISYDAVFRDIPLREITLSEYSDLSLGKTIPSPGDDSLADTYVFLSYRPAGFLSIVQKNEHIYTIVKNNV